MSTLLIENVRQLVTLSGSKRPRIHLEMRELGILENGWMLVENGSIRIAGLAQDARPTADDTVDAAGGIVLPGWVDAHTHTVFAGSRIDEFEQRCMGATYEQIAEKGGGIRSTMRETRLASAEELLRLALIRSKRFLAGGTTTIECKSGYGLSMEGELKMLEVIEGLGLKSPLTVVATFLGAHATPPEMSRDAYVESIANDILPRATSRAKYMDIFVERGYFTSQDARRLARSARELGLGLRMHVDQLTDSGGAALAADLGADTADHLEQTSSEGFVKLRDAGVMPVVLPGSVYSLGLEKYADARGMIDAGLPLVLATDFNPGSSPSTSMPMMLSLACTHMRMTPAEAIVAATINAAFSLGLQDRKGSLEPGKDADFVIWDVADYREIPYRFGESISKRVFVSGLEAPV